MKYYSKRFTVYYCKRCYFRGINFSRFAAQKHIRGLLNLRWADAHCHFCTAQSQYSMNDTFTSMYMYITGHACTKTKQVSGSDRLEYIYPFASTHMVNTQLLRVQNVHTKYCKYFRGFLNSRLLNLREIRENLCTANISTFTVLPQVNGFKINPALIVHLLNSLGSILARHLFRGAHMPHQATNNVLIMPGTHLYTWMESSNMDMDNMSCCRTKVPGIDRNRTRNPVIQSQGFNPIYHGTSSILGLRFVRHVL